MQHLRAHSRSTKSKCAFFFFLPQDPQGFVCALRCENHCAIVFLMHQLAESLGFQEKWNTIKGAWFPE